MRARAFNTVAIWVRSVGANAAIPMLLVVSLLGAATGFDWIAGSGQWIAAVLVVGTVMTIPLSVLWAHLPGETVLERACRERSQARARSAVEKMGLTPEQYVETIPAQDLIARVEVEMWLGIAAPGASRRWGLPTRALPMRREPAIQCGNQVATEQIWFEGPRSGLTKHIASAP